MAKPIQFPIHLRPRRTHNWMFHAETFETPPTETLRDVQANLTLRRLMQRAVSRERAPQYLVNTIRAALRQQPR